jgi:hypothetical protein
MDFKRDREILKEAIKNGYKTVAQLALFIKIHQAGMVAQA